MKTNKKILNGVKVMREIRDQLNKEFETMSFEEEKEYIRKNLQSTAFQDANQKSSKLVPK